LVAGQHVLPDLIDQRGQQIACSTYPISKRRAIQIEAFTSEDLRLAIKGKMIGILRDQHRSQKTWPGKSALNRPEGAGASTITSHFVHAILSQTWRITL
jgi:hypothetical protein